MEEPINIKGRNICASTCGDNHRRLSFHNLTIFSYYLNFIPDSHKEIPWYNYGGVLLVIFSAKIHIFVNTHKSSVKKFFHKPCDYRILGRIIQELYFCSTNHKKQWNL